jgi:hypothetical protein
MTITEKDFENLTSTSMRWARENWELQEDRFPGNIRYDWEMAYWFDDFASIILAKNYLEREGIPFQETYDEAIPSPLLLTHYLSPIWADKEMSGS